jgi:hypothetical protein
LNTLSLEHDIFLFKYHIIELFFICFEAMHRNYPNHGSFYLQFILMLCFVIRFAHNFIFLFIIDRYFLFFSEVPHIASLFSIVPFRAVIAFIVNLG